MNIISNKHQSLKLNTVMIFEHKPCLHMSEENESNISNLKDQTSHTNTNWSDVYGLIRGYIDVVKMRVVTKYFMGQQGLGVVLN